MNDDGSKHVLILVVFIVFAGLMQLYTRFWYTTADIELGGERLEVALARNLYQSHKGLGKRSSLGSWDGMLFPMDFEAKHAFVMRDMEFAIDIIWFDDMRVVDIASSLQPEPGVSESELRRYQPRVKADAVLEVPAGWSKAHNLKIGDELFVYE